MRCLMFPPSTDDGRALASLIAGPGKICSTTTNPASWGPLFANELSDIRWDEAAGAGVTAEWIETFAVSLDHVRLWRTNASLIVFRDVMALVLDGARLDQLDSLTAHGMDPTTLRLEEELFGEAKVRLPLEEDIDRALEVLSADKDCGVPPRATSFFSLRRSCRAADAAKIPYRLLPWWERSLEIGRWARPAPDRVMPSWEEDGALLQQWVALIGPDGWTWPAAGFSVEETRTLTALPERDPVRPNRDQLLVMAALRAGPTTNPKR